LHVGAQFSGAHSSWTFSYFLLKMSGTSHERLEEIDRKFNDAKSLMSEQTFPHDFHSPLALADVICGTLNCPIFETSSVCRPAKIVMDNCHTPGS
jgi:hypothetical protein